MAYAMDDLESILEEPDKFSLRERADVAAVIVYGKRRRERSNNSHHNSKGHILEN